MIYRFDSFELDRSQYRLSGEHTSIPIQPLVLELLVYLIEHRERVVSKEELLAEIWKERFVSEGVVTEAIHEARRALGEDASRAVYIKTLRGRGYQFLFRPVEVLSGEKDSRPAEASVAFLFWTGGPTPLRKGENLIGRDAASVVVLDGMRVSRHHARLVVSSGTAIVEDLGSKNGTVLNGSPLSAPTSLSDGDVIEIGGFAFTFRSALGDLATLTSVNRPRHARASRTG